MATALAAYIGGRREVCGCVCLRGGGLLRGAVLRTAGAVDAQSMQAGGPNAQVSIHDRTVAVSKLYGRVRPAPP